MRDVLCRLELRDCSHVGLAYDVLAPVGRGDGKVADGQRGSWLAGIGGIGEDRDYREALARWRESFAVDGRCRVVETTSRLLVGHGNPSGSDVGLTVQHTWGVPMIPGSALAGVLAHYVHEQLAGPPEGWAQEPERARWRGPTYDDRGVAVEPPGELYAYVFGSPEIADDRAQGRGPSPGSRGRVTFCDALWVPAPSGARPLQEDVLTVHHKDYYGQHGAVPPTDHDDPTPVSFLGVGRGVRFLLALCGPAEWTAVAMRLLIDALAWSGVGGKTSAGYGRLRAVDDGEGEGSAGEESAGEQSVPRAGAGGREAGVRVEPGSVLAELEAWLAGHAAAKTRAHEVMEALDQQWAARLVRLGVEERLVAGRWIRKAIKHRKLEDAAKALSRRIEAGEG